MLKKLLGELVGTFSIMFAGLGSLMVAHCFPGTVPASVVPLIFGMSVMIMVYTLGHISGAHFNPAVTFAFALVRHFPLKHVLLYWVAQLLGVFLALWLLTTSLPAGLEQTLTAPQIPVANALIWEVILTFFLMFVVMSLATDTRAIGTMAGPAIGAIVAVCCYVGGPVTGASMNPARSIVPALLTGQTENLWIYIAGPMLGAALAALLYENVLSEKKNLHQRDV